MNKKKKLHSTWLYHILWHRLLCVCVRESYLVAPPTSCGKIKWFMIRSHLTSAWKVKCPFFRARRYHFYLFFYIFFSFYTRTWKNHISREILTSIPICVQARQTKYAKKLLLNAGGHKLPMFQPDSRAVKLRAASDRQVKNKWRHPRTHSTRRPCSRDVGNLNQPREHCHIF